MAQLSDDCFAHGGRLMTTAEALAHLTERVEPGHRRRDGAPHRGPGPHPGRGPGGAPSDVPPHDNSAVDGYAVFFDDLDPEAETRLPVAGRAAAGHPLGGPGRAATAVRIFTGAPMPEGPDTVMMQEDCRLEGEEVVIAPGIRRGANQPGGGRGHPRRQGPGPQRRGSACAPRTWARRPPSAAPNCRGFRPLKVALFSTGDELREPGTPSKPGCIYDSNRVTVSALLQGLGCRVADLGILRPDDADVIRSALESGRRRATTSSSPPAASRSARRIT